MIHRSKVLQVVSEHYILMGPPTTVQRVDLIEERMATIETELKEIVSQTVDKAVEAMRCSLTEVMMEGQARATQTLGAELEAMTGRLEGRINRSREYHESLINSMRNEQVKFQTEVRSTLTNLHTVQVPSPEIVDLNGSCMGTVVEGVAVTPLANKEMGGGLGGRNVTVGSVVGGGSGGGPGGTTGNFGGTVGGGIVGYGGGNGNWRYRKLDMPVFDGEDPDGWILRVERYFAFYHLSEMEMLEAVVVALDGDALRWYQWENKRHPVRRWADLKQFILRQFRPSSGGSLYEQWLSTTQNSSVSEYQRKFIETAAPLEHVSEEMLMGHFINGLKEDIKAEVRLLNPLCLEQAMEQAVRVEEKLKISSYRRTGLSSIKTGTFSMSGSGVSAVPPYSGFNSTSPTMSKAWSSRSSVTQASVSSPKPAAMATTVGEIKRLTERELQEKRAKGLCYRCDAKWVTGHRCARRELSVMLIEDEEGEVENEGLDSPQSSQEELMTEVSLNSVIGLSNPKTMKLKGLLGNHEVVVMIDPGATHNFISLATVTRAGVKITDSGSFGVSLGNGEPVKGEGMCKGVVIQLDGGVEVEEDFLPLKLGSSDIILGIQWLEKLGMVLTNWKTQVMKFEVKGEPVTLVGDPTLVKSQVSLKAMLKGIKKQGGGYWVECSRMEATVQSKGMRAEQSDPGFLSEVLSKNHKVFDSPVGLPPKS